MSSSGNWLSYAERGGALRTRQTFFRSLQVSLCSQFTPLDFSPLFYASLFLAFFFFSQVMVRRRRNLLFKLLLLMICISVVAGVYVVGFSTEEEDMERGGGRHRERGGVEEGILEIIIKRQVLYLLSAPPLFRPFALSLPLSLPLCFLHLSFSSPPPHSISQSIE